MAKRKETQDRPEITPRLRPRERVRNFIDALEAQPGQTDGRLPTMRELSTHLSVSLATVQAVYGELKAAGRITARVGDGAYLTSASPRRVPREKHRIAINLMRSHETENSLASYYCGSLLQALANSEMKFDLSLLDDERSLEEQAVSLYRKAELDAMIILPFLPCQPLIEACDRERIPYVTIHPANAVTSANFVTPDYYSAGLQIGEAIRQKQRRRVALFTQNGTANSSTGFALVGGIYNGIAEGNYSVELQHCNHSATPNKESLRAWLEERRHALPDVFISHRNNFYQTIMETLQEMNICIPEEACVISTLNGPKELPCSRRVTRFMINFDETAKAAIEMLKQRIANNGSPVPGEKFPITFIGGDTTSVAENGFLRIDQQNIQKQHNH